MNVLEGKSAQYGTSPWYYYPLLVLPAMSGLLLPAVFYSLPASRFIWTMLTASLLLNSLIPHKEIRFIAPLSHLVDILAAKTLATYYRKNSPKKRHKKRYICVLVTIVNLGVWVLLGRWFQCGSLGAVHVLRAKMLHDKGNGSNNGSGNGRSRTPTSDGVLFLMPCHSTPVQSVLHQRDCPVKHLDCQEYDTMLERCFQGHDDCSQILRSKLTASPSGQPFQYISIYDPFYRQVQGLLAEQGYVVDRGLQDRVWNGYPTLMCWNDKRERCGDVLILKKKD